MKFLCSHCKAKYQIADERLSGRTLRMTCRSCGQEILLRGDPSTPSNRAPAPHSNSLMSAPSALGAEFQSAMAASLHPLPPAVPIDEWHVAIDDAPVGPMRREEVARRLSAGGLGPESLAWREGLDDWMPIRAIPELAVLCPPSQMVAPPAGMPPAPIGGRAGAGPAFALDDWSSVADRSGSFADRSGQFAAPGHESSSPALAAPRGPSMPMMFALACGFAFLMSLLTIFGARWLREQPLAAAAPAAQAPTATTQAAPQPSTGTAGQGASDMQIGLAETVQNAPTVRKGGASNGAGSAKPKKELTAAQKEMLARMGGGDNTDLTKLQRAGDQPVAGPGRTQGALSAEQMTGVVQRGKKNLQRCYEVAMRGAGADNTIRLDVDLTVTPNGNATSVSVRGQGLPGMAECIQRTVKMWRFPNASEATPLSFPLLFQPGA
jgi:hypothetical protein